MAHYVLSFENVFARVTRKTLPTAFLSLVPVRSPVASGLFSTGTRQIITLGPILYGGLGRLHFAGEHTSFAFRGIWKVDFIRGLQWLSESHCATRWLAS